VAAGFDAIICPTVPVIPPRLDEFGSEDDYRRINMLCLRNTTVFNFLDGCSISLPMHQDGTPPTGLMLSRPNGGDHALFAAATAAESALG